MPGSRRMVPKSSIRLLFLLTALAFAPACADKTDGPTPVLSGPPTTTFPMPPASHTSFADLGWVILPSSEKASDTERGKVGDYQGKILIIDMYATWCEPCRQSIPHLVDLQSRYRQAGLEIVGLNVGGPDDRVKVAAFAQELKINYALGFPDRQLTDLLMADDSSIPQTFVFDREGTLAQRFIGHSEITAGQLEKVIQTLTSTQVR